MVEKYKLICSNCGKINIYNKLELDKVFPFSRELLDCKFCKNKLSVCTGFMGIY